MNQPLAIDLFCGAGGASMGLHRAGYRVVGVDIKPQPHYPFEFVQADALTYDLTGASLVWASPPCQAYSASTQRIYNKMEREHPKLIGWVRAKLQAWGGAYIIENVVGAPLFTTVVLCGTMFGLKVIRHRLFESNMMLWAHPHDMSICGNAHIYENGGDYSSPFGNPNRKKGLTHQWRAAMGIDWMNRDELAQAIPPAYSEYLAKQLIGLHAPSTNTPERGAIDASCSNADTDTVATLNL